MIWLELIISAIRLYLALNKNVSKEEVAKINAALVDISKELRIANAHGRVTGDFSKYEAILSKLSTPVNK